MFCLGACRTLFRTHQTMVFVYMSLFLSVPSFCVAEDGGFVENSLGSVYSLSALLLFIFLAATWFFIHACVSPVLPGLLLPRSARRLHREKEQRLLELEQLEKESVGKDGDTHREELDKLRAYFITSNANATASLHALYLVPAALFHALSSVILPSAQLVVARAAAAASKRVLLSEGGSAEGPDLLTANAAVSAAESKRRNIWDTYLAHWNEAPDFWGGENNPVVILSAYIMASYFFWDSIECFRNLRIHRRAFLIHGLISFLAAVVEILAPGMKLAGFSSLFALSELSTPFLHLRWFLLHNGQAGKPFFVFINAVTVFLFISVRLVILPLFVFSHYWADFFLHRSHLTPEAISGLRMVFMVVLTFLWTSLNYYWGFLFFRSLCKKRDRQGRCGRVSEVEKKED